MERIKFVAPFDVFVIELYPLRSIPAFLLYLIFLTRDSSDTFDVSNILYKWSSAP